jgi:menaquinone-dependent protoporphyrinogen oxidase
MNVLVAYSSKHGSTAEIAEAIAGALERSGLTADCRDAGEVKDLTAYDAVVVGSAVYMRRWRGEARRFLRKHADELAERPFWVFSTGPTGEPTEGDKESRWAEPAKIVHRAEDLGVRGHVVFGGKIPTDSHWPGSRAMVEGTPEEFRDRRDWDEIGSWASEIAVALGATVPSM